MREPLRKLSVTRSGGGLGEGKRRLCSCVNGARSAGPDRRLVAPGEDGKTDRPEAGGFARRGGRSVLSRVPVGDVKAGTWLPELRSSAGGRRTVGAWFAGPPGVGNRLMIASSEGRGEGVTETRGRIVGSGVRTTGRGNGAGRCDGGAGRTTSTARVEGAGGVVSRGDGADEGCRVLVGGGSLRTVTAGARRRSDDAAAGAVRDGEKERIASLEGGVRVLPVVGMRAFSTEVGAGVRGLPGPPRSGVSRAPAKEAVHIMIAT